MKTQKLKQMTIARLCTIAAAFVCSSALADRYVVWVDEVKSASNGLEVCIDSYASALGGARPPEEVAKRMKRAKESCNVLKSQFDVVMLTARSRVDNLQGPLANFHEAVLEAFDFVVPKKGQSPLEYAASTSKTKLSLAELQSLLLQQSEINEALSGRTR